MQNIRLNFFDDSVHIFARLKSSNRNDVWSLAIDNGSLFAGSWGGGVRLFSDTTWTEVNTGVADPIIISVAASNSQSVFAGSLDGNIFHTTDRGSNWTLSNPGMTNTPIAALAASPSGFIFAGTNGDGIFRNLRERSATPVLVSPANDDTVSTDDIVLSWIQVVGVTNQLQLSLEPTFQTSVVDAGGLAAGGFLVQDLINETTYYWRLNATNPVGTSDWSSTDSFRTNIPPSVPALVAPEDRSGGLDTTVTLVWPSAKRAVSYQLQYSMDSTFRTGFTVTGLVDTTFTALGLQANATYYWRVNATNAGGTSDWATVRTFITGTITSVAIGDEIPRTFHLSQNYPNPFNPETTIGYDLPKAAHVTLTIYNLLGQNIRTLVQREQPSGTILWFGMAGTKPGARLPVASMSTESPPAILRRRRS